MKKDSKKTSKKSKILLVEDDKLISNALTSGLDLVGFSVSAAFDGQEAINKTKKIKPNLILLDLMLPKKSGFEVLEEIKKDKNLKSIPVLVLSNLEDEADVVKAKSYDVADYLLKSSFSLDEIVAKIKEYI